MMGSSDRPPYGTEDLVEATYLVQLGHDARLEPVSARSVEFRFERTEELRDARLRLRNGEARVDPRGFHRTMTEMRRRIDQALGTRKRSTRAS